MFIFCLHLTLFFILVLCARSTGFQAAENRTNPLGTIVFFVRAEERKKAQYLKMQQGPTFTQTKISEDEIFRLLVQPHWSGIET